MSPIRFDQSQHVEFGERVTLTRARCTACAWVGSWYADQTYALQSGARHEFGESGCQGTATATDRRP